MRKVCFGQSECRGTAVRYYLLVEDWKGMGENYGFQIKYGRETVTVPRITSSQRRIQTLLGVLVRGCVTPVTAREVVEDWLNK